MKLNDTIFNLLLKEIDKTPIASDEEVINRSTIPAHFKKVQENKATTYIDGTLIHLSTKNDNLNNIIKDITNRDTEHIIAFHLMTSEPPAYVSEHKDSGSDLTLVILLEDKFEGGYAYIEGKQYEGMRTSGEYIMYKGGEVSHSVSKITKGRRKVLVVWYKKPKNLL